MSMPSCQDILNYWFDGLDDQQKIRKSSPIVKRWFVKSRRIDEDIRERFEEVLLMAGEGKYAQWENTMPGRLSLILLFDQFSRNIHRGTVKMYATDSLALALSLRAIDEGLLDSLPLVHRVFVYMPLMHAEDLALQEKSVACFSKLVDAARTKSPHNADYFSGHLKYAVGHRDIIARFGRFPHRNGLFNRSSTLEEIAFLKQPGALF
jgi:uncharacterized protein (DUF924 family)